jgi:hypothetical protein
MKITSDLTNLTTVILILTVQMFTEWTCLKSSMGGWAPYVSNFGIFTSSTNTITFLPKGAPSKVFFFFSSFNSRISCVLKLLVCAEKLIVTGTYKPVSNSLLRTSFAITDFPTPAKVINSILWFNFFQAVTRISHEKNWIVDVHEALHHVTEPYGVRGGNQGFKERRVFVVRKSG